MWDNDQLQTSLRRNTQLSEKEKLSFWHLRDHFTAEEKSELSLLLTS